MAHGDSPAVTVTFTNKLWHTTAGSPRNSTTSQCPWYIPSTCTVLWEKTQHSPSQGGTPTPCAPLPEHGPRAPQHPSLPQLCHGGIPMVPKAPLGSAGPHGTVGPVLPSEGSDPTHQCQQAPLLPSAISPFQSPHWGCPGTPAICTPAQPPLWPVSAAAAKSGGLGTYAKDSGSGVPSVLLGCSQGPGAQRSSLQYAGIELFDAFFKRTVVISVVPSGPPVGLMAGFSLPSQPPAGKKSHPVCPAEWRGWSHGTPWQWLCL